MEYRTWTQGTTFITRAGLPDAPLVQRARVLPVGRAAARIEDKIPERATLIRVLMLELNRISSHLGGSGRSALSSARPRIFLQGVRMRENVLDVPS